MHVIKITPMFRMYQVSCSQGCNLGTSAVQESLDAAQRRADLHAAAARIGGHEH